MIHMIPSASANAPQLPVLLYRSEERTIFSPQRVLLLTSKQPYISDCPVREDFNVVVAYGGRRSFTRIKQQGVSYRKQRSRSIFPSSFESRRLESCNNFSKLRY